MDIIIKILISALAVFVTAYLLKGVTVKNFGSAILVAIVLGVVNAIVRPVFVFLTIPLRFLLWDCFCW